MNSQYTPITELKALLKSGRELVLNLEDAGQTTDESGKEFKDITEFKLALDRAAKAVKS